MINNVHLPLFLSDIPHATLRLGLPTISLQSIQEGNDIYFDCLVDSNPAMNRAIIWRFNGQILHAQAGWFYMQLIKFFYTFIMLGNLV